MPAAISRIFIYFESLTIDKGYFSLNWSIQVAQPPLTSFVCFWVERKIKNLIFLMLNSGGPWQKRTSSEPRQQISIPLAPFLCCDPVVLSLHIHMAVAIVCKSQDRLTPEWQQSDSRVTTASAVGSHTAICATLAKTKSKLFSLTSVFRILISTLNYCDHVKKIV